MIPKIYIQENTHIFDEPYDNIWGSGVPSNASVDLIQWIKDGFLDGTFSGGVAGASNLSIGASTSTGIVISNTNGTGVALPSATTSLAGLLTATNLVNINSLIALTGLTAGSLILGTFTGSTIGNSATIKSALQSLEIALETKGTNLLFQDDGVNTGVAGSATTINFVGSSLTATQMGNTLTLVGNGNVSTVVASLQYYTIIPASTNTVAALSPLPLDSTKVLIIVNGQVEKIGISVNASGVFTITPLSLGYNIESTDTIVVQYFA